MIVERILQNAQAKPEKVALVTANRCLTYGELAVAINDISHTIQARNQGFILQNDHPIDDILTLLALQLTRNFGVILPNEYPEEDKITLAENHNLQEFTNAYDSQYNSINTNPYFLGVCTSGSSGKPKLILKDNACWETAFPHQSTVFGITENDKIGVLDAMAYSANLNAVLHGLWQGCEVHFLTLKRAAQWPQHIDTQNITSLFLVPSHLQLISKKRPLPTLNSVVTAGEKLSAALAKDILETAPNACLTEYYGAAELGHISYHQNESIVEHPYSVGVPFPEVVISEKNHTLHVKSPYVSPEYRSSGTVHDLGYFKDGKLILLGREGRLFNRRGLNIFAREIEQKALQSELVKAARLVAVLPKNANQKLALAVVPVATQQPTSGLRQQLQQYLLAVLPPQKLPNFLVFLDELPTFSNGKYDDFQLQKIITASRKSSSTKTIVLD